MAQKEYTTAQYAVVGVIAALGAMAGLSLAPGALGPVVGAVAGSIFGYKLARKM
jgi:hypothetical protein